jgi:hypothetical protein
MNDNESSLEPGDRDRDNPDLPSYRDQEMADLRAQLAAVTRERDELKASLYFKQLGSVMGGCVIDEQSRMLDATREELSTLRAQLEARFDCHGGPGTTIEACGACLTCVMRDRDGLAELFAAAKKDTARLDLLEKAFRNMPDLQLVFAEDDDSEENIGLIPQGWNMRCDSVCAEPLTVHAQTFREMLDGFDAATQPEQS